MSTSATTTYRPRGYRSCRSRMVFSTVLPVENSSSTRTSGPSPASSEGSSGSSRCDVAWECDSSKPPARATPGTGRRVECRYGAVPRPSATAWPSPVAVSAYPRTTAAPASASPSSAETRRPRRWPYSYTTAGDCGTCLPSTFDTSRWARLGLRRRARPSRAGSPSSPTSSTPSRSATQLPDHTPSFTAFFMRSLDDMEEINLDQPGIPAASSSTKPTSSWATPKASARSRVRSAQARCGFTSFILFV